MNGGFIRPPVGVVIREDMKEEIKKAEKSFDTVAFFRTVKEKIAKATEGMTLQERCELFQKIREGKVTLA
ncbi:MAG: hypothetical protein LBR08_09410 [Bacteroidales bacterium]|jgi:hypothetical protein|nr:hypothetical protein [Bacteroidales bacterium]